MSALQVNVAEFPCSVVPGVGEVIAANPAVRSMPYTCMCWTTTLRRSAYTTSRTPYCHPLAGCLPSRSARSGFPIESIGFPQVDAKIKPPGRSRPGVQLNVTVLPVNFEPGVGVFITPPADAALYAV